ASLALADIAAAPRSEFMLKSTRYAGDPPTAKTDVYISDGNDGTIGGGGSTAKYGDPGDGLKSGTIYTCGTIGDALGTSSA
ncbi:MAG: hypothetical protein KBD65_03815, partial [Candidatus Moranbacteria bacterium]|nr:hypothetical protein [Candidatus Moranbacteria bacterium]